MTPVTDLPTLAQGIALALYALCQAGLVAYSSHRWPMLLGAGPAPAPLAPWWEPGAKPRVLVQLPVFEEPAGVGLVQARWGHLNRDANRLTRAQAAMLDAHFLLEHAWRQRMRRFMNFNGTAGVWRRACIESAGGWSADTLTEDLDLSYRAQL